MMTRSAKGDHSALLLEGWDDKRFYLNYLHARCLSFALDGRSEVIGTLLVLARRGQNGIAGVIDADCDHLERAACPSNVMRSDFRDLECFLINSSALYKVLHEYLIDDDVQAVREKLFKACRDIGILRWQVFKNGWYIDFKSMDFAQFIDAATLVPNRVELCREVIRRNPNFVITEQDLLDSIRLGDDARIDSLHYCSGHDLTTVLAMWITKRTNVKVLRSNVEQHLRLALDLISFLRTKLVQQIRDWEAKNIPFRLFKDFVPVKPEKVPAAKS
jgi:hypothetical protein